MRKSKGGAPQAPRERQAGAAKNHERGWGGGYVTMERMNSLGSICLTERADRRVGEV